MHASRMILLILLATVIMLAPHAGMQAIIIPIPPNPPPSPQPPPQPLGLIVVDDDGADCPNANFITMDLSRIIDFADNNATIVICTGTYRGFSNAIVNSWGKIIGYKPLTVEGNGSVEIIYDHQYSLGNTVFQNVELIVNSRLSFRGEYAKFKNTLIVVTTTPSYYCVQEPSDTWSGLGFKITGELLLYNTTLTSTNCGALKGYMGEVYVNNSILDVAVRVYDAQLFVMHGSVKTSRGSEDFKTGFTGIGLVISSSQPSLKVYTSKTIIEKSKISGTMYIRSQTTVLRKNIVDFNTSLTLNLPVHSLWQGFDGVIIDSLNYTIEYNVIKDYTKLPHLRQLYAALRIIRGTGVIRRNLFYDNDAALIVDSNASPIVYDNVFIKNNIHMASIQSTEIASIDPPRPGPNIIGGPLLGGNYWDDYVGPDLNGDGLGDIPYVNDYNVVDIHPLTPWSLIKCPPYMGGHKLATSGTSSYTLFRSSLILLAALALGVAITGNHRRLRGLTGIISIATTLAIVITLIVLVFQISYTTSISILAKPISPLVPLGGPLIINSRLHLTLHNPGPAPVCVKYAIINSSKTTLYPVQQEYIIDLANILEKQLVKGEVNYTLILGELVNALIIEPKDSKEFTAYVGEVKGIADLSIITNNGVWRMHAFGES